MFPTEMSGVSIFTQPRTEFENDAWKRRLSFFQEHVVT